MPWETVLSSAVIVAVFAVVAEIVKKWRTRGERQTLGFQELQSVVDAYKEMAATHQALAKQANDALLETLRDLDEAKEEINLLRVKVLSMESALESAYATIKQMLDMVKSLETSG